MEGIQVRIFTFLAQLGILSAVYALTEVIRLWTYWRHLNGLYFLFAVLIMLSGFAAGMAVFPQKPGKLRKQLKFALYIIPAAFILIVFRGNSSGVLLLELLAGFAFYYIGLAGSMSDYRKMYNKNTIIAYGIILAVAYFYMRSYRIDERAWIYICIYVFAIALILSQRKIDSAFTRNNEVLFKQIGKMRAFNGAAALLFSALVLLAANSQGMRKLANQATHGISRIVAWIFLSFVRLFSLLGGIDRHIEKEEAGSLGLLPSKYGRPELFTFLIYAAGIAALLLLLAYCFKRFMKLLSGPAAYTRRVSGASEHGTAKREYYDIIERIIGKRRGANRGELDRRLAQLSRIADPAAKVRHLYGLLIDALLFRGIDLKKSDTTGQICKKSMDLNIKDSFIQINRLTIVYNSVRYGDRLPEDRQVSEIERDCTALFREMGL